jgi:hypothetical protein
MKKIMWGVNWQTIQLMLSDQPRYVKKKKKTTEEEFLAHLGAKVDGKC